MGTAEAMLAAARASLGISGRPNEITRDYAKRHGEAFLRAPWCDMAVTYWARQSGNQAAVLPKGDRAYTVWHAQDFLRIGRWHTGTAANLRKAKPGDIVFFDWSGTNDISKIDHVGVIEKVLGDGRIVTIEGNTSDACKRRVRSAGEVAGYGRPAYDPPAPPKPKTVFGIDYAWGRPLIPAMKKAGVKFVCRYLSHDTTGKNLTKSEADQLTKAGLWIVVVWETTAKRALSGRSAGIIDAQDADRMAKACGMPAGRPIYFAVDFDAQPAQQAAINAYLDGAASVIGRSRVGIYGGYGPVKRALDAGKAHWAWQTYAWSGGRWDSRADIQQYANGKKLGGADVDHNRAKAADYGQWHVGGMPAPPRTAPPKPKPGTQAPPWPGRYITQPPVMTGDDVRTWQARMKARGWNITVDGAYGPKSEEVCRAFQEDKGLTVDGVIGPITWRLAWEAPIT